MLPITMFFLLLLKVLNSERQVSCKVTDFTFAAKCDRTTGYSILVVYKGAYSYLSGAQNARSRASRAQLLAAYLQGAP